MGSDPPPLRVGKQILGPYPKIHRPCRLSSVPKGSGQSTLHPLPAPATGCSKNRSECAGRALHAEETCPVLIDGQPCKPCSANQGLHLIQISEKSKGGLPLTPSIRLTDPWALLNKPSPLKLSSLPRGRGQSALPLLPAPAGRLYGNAPSLSYLPRLRTVETAESGGHWSYISAASAGATTGAGLQKYCSKRALARGDGA